MHWRWAATGRWIVAGLWMATAVVAYGDAGEPIDGALGGAARAATANSGLALDVSPETSAAGQETMIEAAEEVAESPMPPPADIPLIDFAEEVTADATDKVRDAAPASAGVRSIEPDADRMLYPQPQRVEADSAAAPVRAPRQEIPRSARSRNEQLAAFGGERNEPIAAPTTPWYRTPYAALGGVLALIFGLTLLVRRYFPAARPVAADVLRVIGRVPIGGKQSAVLLHVGRRLVLVGMGPDAMRTLAEITDPEEVSQLLGKTNSKRIAGHSFDRMLAEELNEYAGESLSATEESPENAVRETLQVTRGQLETLRNRIRSLQSA